jgi:anti-sigma-K factor RskA
MSAVPDFEDERDALAAEYVLGVLDAAERDRARRLLLTDPDFADFVRAWEARLSPLANSIAPVPPPASLWARIEATLDDAAGAPAAVPVPGPGWAGRMRFWRGTTIAAGALAAGLAAFIVLRAPNAPPVQAVLTGSGAPVFVASVERDGAILVSALGTPAVPAGHDLELWVLPVGATRPASLGVLPAAGKQVPRGVATTPGTQLLVSLEPPGGSPTGQPTGPVLYAGKLERL